MKRRTLTVAGIAAAIGLAIAACSDEDVAALFRELYLAPAFSPGVVSTNASDAYDGITLFKHAGKNQLVAMDMDGTSLRVFTLPENSEYQHLDWARPLDGGELTLDLGTQQQSAEDRFPPHKFVRANVFAQILQTWEGGPGLRRLHHDSQVLANGHTLLLVSPPNTYFPDIGGTIVQDDVIFEIDELGNVVWIWSTGAHYSELPLTMEDRDSLAAQDWIDIFHTNSIRVIPPNSYDLGTYPELTPGNIIVSERATSSVFIIDKETGSIVWSLDQSMIGHLHQHHPSMIPMGFPGAGNILLFDNGCCTTGLGEDRDYSRVLEIDPTNQSIVWEYHGSMTDGGSTGDFYTTWGGSVQRLPNGNTLITSSAQGRIFEVDYDTFDIVWDFTIVSEGGTGIYRSYRVDHEWLDGGNTGMGHPFPW